MRPRAWRRPALWGGAYVSAVALASLMGWLTLGVGNALFILGGVLILASLRDIRHGGPRRIVVARDITGHPEKAPLPADERAAEIRRGVILFSLGVGTWIPLAVIALAT